MRSQRRCAQPLGFGLTPRRYFWQAGNVPSRVIRSRRSADASRTNRMPPRDRHGPWRPAQLSALIERHDVARQVVSFMIVTFAFRGNLLEYTKIEVRLSQSSKSFRMPSARQRLFRPKTGRTVVGPLDQANGFQAATLVSSTSPSTRRSSRVDVR